MPRVGVIGHLWHPFGRHETGDLDLGQASGLQAVYQFDFDGSGDWLFLVLQPVTGANFYQLHAGGEVHIFFSR
jgi:hypothetical protein